MCHGAYRSMTWSRERQRREEELSQRTQPPAPKAESPTRPLETAETKASAKEKEPA